MLTMQVVELPNGGFVIVFSGMGVTAADIDGLDGLKEATGACAIVVGSIPIEVRR
jgi:hypothetical protein